jgi:hypothetical protein
MRKLIILSLFFCGFVFQAQNWNVFNRGYRYNYRYNNADVVTNVLFVRWFTVNAGDTVYSMNNIAGVTSTTVIPDFPQFLMKKIIKQADGTVRFEDTLNFKIEPYCSLNQSWIFSTNPATSATCVATETISVFSVIDSVKTIVVANTDTIKLSKQFGLLQFPQLFGQNKYYKLTGIEKAGRYDSTAFYGERVPNAWDFYKFQVNDKRCIDEKSQTYGDPANHSGSCRYVTQHFNSKTVLPTGFSYTLYQVGTVNTGLYSTCSWSACPFPPTSYQYSMCAINSSVITETYVDLHKADLLENYMYPGMLMNYPFEKHFVKFGKDVNGRFFKFCGVACNQLTFAVTAPTSTTSLHNNNPFGIYFGDGLGKTSDLPYVFEGNRYYCVTSFVKGTQTYFNPFYTVDLKEEKFLKYNSSVYPNPGSESIRVKISGPATIRILNSLGKLVHEMDAVNEGKEISVSHLPEGIYLLEVKNDSGMRTEKLIISR